MTGRSVRDGRVIRSTSPWSPSESIGEWADIGPTGVDAAVALARQRSREWGAASAFERAEALRTAADHLEDRGGAVSQLVVREVGKPLREAQAEVARAVAILRYYASAALDADGESFPAPDGRSWLLTRRRPRGVVGLITPWNFPVAIPMWKLAPAIAWGNVVLLKPARDALATAMLISEVLDLPTGVLQVVPTGVEGASALISHPDLDAISFTGSAPVGRTVALAAAESGIPAQAEMGGSNPAILLPDADPEKAAAVIAGAAMTFAGQKCTATRRVIVVGQQEQFRDALVAAVRALPVGDPSDPSTLVGPVISDHARTTIEGSVAASLDRGARPLIGGEPVRTEGHLIQPVVLDGLEHDDALAREELFGPVVTPFQARGLEEAIELANATAYDLVASVHTGDLGVAMRVVDRLEAGLVRVNAPTTGVDFHIPFGGEKGSSVGPREQGRAAREFYTTSATITVAPPD